MFLPKLFQGHSKIINDSLFYYLGKLVPGLVGFFSVPLFIRLFGASVYGEYSIFISTIMLIATFSSGWIGHTFMRFYTLKEDKEGYTYFIYKIFLSFNLIIASVLFIILILLNYSLIISLMIMLVYLFLTLYSLMSLETKAKLLSKHFVTSDSIRSIVFLSTILALYFIFKKNSNVELLFLFGGNLVSYFTGSMLLKRRFFTSSYFKSTLNYKFDKKLFKELLQFGLPIALWTVTAYLLNISDRYVIKYFYSFEEVGIYSAIYDLFYKFVTLAFSPLMVAIHPIVMKLYNEGKIKKVRLYLRVSLLLQIIAFLLFFILVSIFKEKIVFNFLKIDNLNALTLVAPIFTGAFFWSISMLVHKPFELKKKTLIMFYGILLAFSINLIGNILFIPKFGIIAAAYTTLIGTFSYLLFIILRLLSYKGSIYSK